MEREIGFKEYIYTYIISFGDLLEFSLGLFLIVRVFIRMPLHGKLSIGFLKVIVFGSLVDLKNLVVVDPHPSYSASLLALHRRSRTFSGFLAGAASAFTRNRSEKLLREEAQPQRQNFNVIWAQPNNLKTSLFLSLPHFRNVIYFLIFLFCSFNL